MQFYSTNNKNFIVNFKDAILEGLAKDNGLFMPESIPTLSAEQITNIKNMSIKDIAYEILSLYTKDEIPEKDLIEIIEKTFLFDSPIKQFDENISILELFHGPTFAFKDFGARFLANTSSYLLKDSDKQITVIVATSGDTGSAVASAFYGLPNSKVYLLYPSNKVSKIQEQQLTTFGNNITALEILGDFDDCQKIVKTLLVDNDLKNKYHLTSANSINIGRLLPQIVYYFRAYAQINTDKEIVFSVPSGNFGNLTAGILANKMGLPVKHFIASLNSNDVFYKFLKTGKFEPQPTKITFANAMDVGNPSNFWRIWDIYNKNYDTLKQEIHSYSFSNENIIEGINIFYNKYKYLIEPHSSCGFLGIENDNNPYHNIFLGTAHPAKFIDIIEKYTNYKVDIPVKLKDVLEKEKQSIKVVADANKVKEIIY
ncbi:MAG TPA: threonine synthase [Ignavibacteriales bacterium]|nr:threonine synthase [Ignavibacteriales bacterium]HOL80726.1 threonine synthase [Ignavibacteriales bacterium]HOM64414.1 threonine synthase [Ignavibacteriales bacterium]HPD67202.1 threonine synthase [Ignavibacteriales bacterium]HPP32941.1 threonine synthase [Ignavibacteriales bacterium]